MSLSYHVNPTSQLVSQTKGKRLFFSSLFSLSEHERYSEPGVFVWWWWFGASPYTHDFDIPNLLGLVPMSCGCEKEELFFVLWLCACWIYLGEGGIGCDVLGTTTAWAGRFGGLGLSCA